MVSVIQEQNPFGNLGQALGQGVGQGFMNRSDELSLKKAVENLPPGASYQDVLKTLTGTQTYSSEAKQKAIENYTKGFEFQEKAKEAKAKEDKAIKEKLDKQKLEDEGYNKVKELFGDKIADAWKVSTEGGKTEILKHIIDAYDRGEDLNKIFSHTPSVNKALEENSAEETDEIKKLPQLENGEVPKDIKWPVFDKKPLGISSKEWREDTAQWRKENDPVYNANKTKLQSSKRDALGIGNLRNLNESRKLPEGFERLLINPDTGDFYGFADVAGLKNPEVQEFVKEIARFQNRAKDAFGSRVTNFDLQSYMKQFPGLLNTYEGRKRILEMMDINNQLDVSYENALMKVYQHYGKGKIPQEKAEELAEHFVSKETEKLREKYLNLNAANQEASGYPSAAENANKTIRDQTSGKRYKSNGTDWVEVK